MTDYYGPEGWGAGAQRERLEHRERVALRLAIRHWPPSRDGAVVADLGCGDGLMLATFAATLPGARLVGFDLSPTQLAKARERLPGAELRTADPTPPFELADGSVDIAYAVEVVEHLWSPDDFPGASGPGRGSGTRARRAAGCPLRGCTTPDPNRRCRDRSTGAVARRNPRLRRP